MPINVGLHPAALHPSKIKRQRSGLCNAAIDTQINQGTQSFFTAAWPSNIPEGASLESAAAYVPEVLLITQSQVADISAQ